MGGHGRAWEGMGGHGRAWGSAKCVKGTATCSRVASPPSARRSPPHSPASLSQSELPWPPVPRSSRVATSLHTKEGEFAGPSSPVASLLSMHPQLCLPLLPPLLHPPCDMPADLPCCVPVLCPDMFPSPSLCALSTSVVCHVCPV